MNEGLDRPVSRPGGRLEAMSRAASGFTSRGAARFTGSDQVPNLMHITDVAEHLGVSVRHIRRLVAERRIPYIKWGTLLRFDPTAVAAWLAERAVEPGPRHRSTPRRTG